MDYSINEIIYFVLLVDSIGANLVAWFGHGWYKKCCFIFSKAFPATRGWTALYLALILWIGSILMAWPF